MRLLLDTHIALAVINLTQDGLPKAHSRHLSEKDHSFVVSAASLWEIAIKNRLGKLPLRIEPVEVSAYLHASEIMVIPVTAEHATAEAIPAPETRDPFDRLLLAVAQVEDAPLVTADARLVMHPLAWSPSPV